MDKEYRRSALFPIIGRKAADRPPSVLDTDGAQYVRTSEFNYWKRPAHNPYEYVRCSLMEFVRNTR